MAFPGGLPGSIREKTGTYPLAQCLGSRSSKHPEGRSDARTRTFASRSAYHRMLHDSPATLIVLDIKVPLARISLRCIREDQGNTYLTRHVDLSS